MKNALLLFSLLIVSQIGLGQFASAQELNVDFEIANVQTLIKENTPPDTELKSARLLIGYSSLLALVAQYTDVGLVQTTPAALKSAISTFEAYENNPAVAAQVDELADALVQVGIGTRNSNESLQNLNSQVTNLLNLKTKYPQAAFVGSLDEMVSLTQDYAKSYQSYLVRVSEILRKCEDVRDLIKHHSPKLKKELKALSRMNSELPAYSLQEISQKFRVIEARLRQSYP